MKVIRGVYIEFNEIDQSQLTYNPIELNQFLESGLDRSMRFGKT